MTDAPSHEEPKFYQQIDSMDCSYLPDRKSNSVFLDPDEDVSVELLNTLHLNGFRRSGRLVYRPHCEGCSECMSCRVINDLFEPSKNQKKALTRNKGIHMRWRESGYYEEHYNLYDRYISERHNDGSMYPPTPEQYKDFIVEGLGNHKFLEFYQGEELVGCSIVDFYNDGLSAVYSYYKPELAKKSIGRFIIVSLIKLSRQYNLPYTYLGYLVRNCQKMSYKAEYQPLQVFNGLDWIRYQIEEI